MSVTACFFDKNFPCFKSFWTQHGSRSLLTLDCCFLQHCSSCSPVQLVTSFHLCYSLVLPRTMPWMISVAWHQARFVATSSTCPTYVDFLWRNAHNNDFSEPQPIIMMRYPTANEVSFLSVSTSVWWWVDGVIQPSTHTYRRRPDYVANKKLCYGKVDSRRPCLVDLLHCQHCFPPSS